jgi:cyclophilin family peptidyl-prolyl cis-trans isomerase
MKKSTMVLTIAVAVAVVLGFAPTSSFAAAPKSIAATSVTLAATSEKVAPTLPLSGLAPQVLELHNVAPELSKERVVFRTNLGDIAVALYPKAAPQHVAQILNLARKGVFDGVIIYRVEPGFVAQIENFDVRKPALTNSQFAEIRKLPAEFNDIHHRRGILSMARYDDPNSAEASFSFVLGEAPSLDRKYTVFGEIVSGIEVLAQFEKNAVGPNGKPRDIEVARTDVFEDGDLSKANLSPAHEYETPDAGVGRVFLIFAICAFAFTILKPIVSTILEKKKPRISPGL